MCSCVFMCVCVCVCAAHGPATLVDDGVVWSSEDAQRASAPTTDRESRCAVRKGGYMVILIAPVTDDSDVQDSQKLGSVRRDARSSTQE